MTAGNEQAELTYVPPIECEAGVELAIVPSLDASRTAVYRWQDYIGWTLIAQYERVGDVAIAVNSL